jgi:hypothetical protein
VAWIITNGSIPNSMHVLHICDNKACCNPAHLYLGTHQDNMADVKARGRVGRGPRGVRRKRDVTVKPMTIAHILHSLDSLRADMIRITKEIQKLETALLNIQSPP